MGQSYKKKIYIYQLHHIHRWMNFSTVHLASQVSEGLFKKTFTVENTQ